MHILAVLLTSNAALIHTLENSRLNLSENILKNARADECQVTTIGFNSRQRTENFSDFLGDRVGLVNNRPSGQRRYDGLVVLHSHDAASHITSIRDAIFASAFDEHTYIENRDNFLVRSFGRLIKNLLALSEKVRSKTCMEAAILPSHNFDSDAFRAFLRLCQEETDKASFPNKISPALKAVTKLRGPRRRSTYPTKYFRDDREIHFNYGHEVHSSFETGGSHRASCSLRGLFRFGIPLEQQRHFNVVASEEGTPLSGSYQNCHSDTITFTDRTHLNMFSNDFFK